MAVQIESQGQLQEFLEILEALEAPAQRDTPGSRSSGMVRAVLPRS